MLRYAFWFALALAGFYAHSRFVFSEANINRWLVDQNVMMMQDAQKACDLAAGDMQVDLQGSGMGEKVSITGGKAEYCEYLKKSSAAYQATQAQVNGQVLDIQVKPSGFSWMRAEVSYKEDMSVSMAGGTVNMKAQNDNHITLVRSFDGLKIKKLQSRSDGEVHVNGQ